MTSLEVLSAAAGGAQILDVTTRGIKAAIGGAIAPGGGRRAGDRRRRESAYVRYQSAVMGQVGWAQYLPALAEAVPSKLSELLFTPALLSQLNQARESTSEFGAALLEIRMVGNPKPRATAEDLAALVAELFERIPRTRRPRSKRREEIERFDECRCAIGLTLRDFTVAAREDLGYASNGWRRRSLSWWRKHADWPGGWPGPNPLDLIAGAQAQSIHRADHT